MYDVWLRITKLIGSNFFHTQKIIRLQYITKSTYLFIPTPLHHSSPRSQIYRYYTINSNFLTFFNLLCASDFKPLSAMELTGGLMIKLTRRKPKKASILASLKLILNGSSRRHFPSKEIPGAHGGKPMGKHDAAKTAKNYFQKSKWRRK